MNDRPDWRYGKDETGFRRVGSGLEPIAVPDPDVATPIEQFFVYNAGHHAEVDQADWAVKINGEVQNEISLTLEQLRGLPQHQVTAWLECAGNGRRLFVEAAGYEIPDRNMQTPWMLGGMGLGEWTGPRLCDVLALANMAETARWVAPRGLDTDVAEPEAPRMCLPLDKALDEDTIIALEMNGQPLPAAHGGPARVLVPGWIGAYSVKWLDELHVSDEWVSSWRSSEYYVLRNAAGEATGPATTHPVKSNLLLDYPGELPSGATRIRGVARSGNGPIVDVQWRLNNGEWSTAQLGTAQGRWGWTPFTIELDLLSGNHVIETRATDDTGMTQPAVQPPHPNGVLWHAITPHPVRAN